MDRIKNIRRSCAGVVAFAALALVPAMPAQAASDCHTTVGAPYVAFNGTNFQVQADTTISCTYTHFIQIQNWVQRWGGGSIWNNDGSPGSYYNRSTKSAKATAVLVCTGSTPSIYRQAATWSIDTNSYGGVSDNTKNLTINCSDF